jgi:LmbE family N-acetylglucosaminyl deacetylase
MYRLLVVAHPDDETIFFGGIVLKERKLPWHLICVTDGNADGRGAERHQELLAAAKRLGIQKVEQWDFPDHFESRLDLQQLVEKLESLPSPKEIYTHGPLGEYVHAHHQDVCLATHRAFPKTKIWSLAWNAYPEKLVKLSPAQYKKRGDILKLYSKETSRFLGLLSNAAVEGYLRYSKKEVEALVGFMRGELKLDPKAWKRHSWLTPHLEAMRERLTRRLF